MSHYHSLIPSTQSEFCFEKFCLKKAVKYIWQVYFKTQKAIHLINPHIFTYILSVLVRYILKGICQFLNTLQTDIHISAYYFKKVQKSYLNEFQCMFYTFDFRSKILINQIGVNSAQIMSKRESFYRFLVECRSKILL